LRCGKELGADLVFHCAFVLGQPGVELVVDGGERRMQAGRGKGRREVADDGGAAPAFGLGGFTDVVHDVGVEHRHVADGEHGEVAHRQAASLPGSHSWLPWVPKWISASLRACSRAHR
jgi:hypothetical protein